jgi:hypothetical protein
MIEIKLPLLHVAPLDQPLPVRTFKTSLRKWQAEYQARRAAEVTVEPTTGTKVAGQNKRS